MFEIYECNLTNIEILFSSCGTAHHKTCQYVLLIVICFQSVPNRYQLIFCYMGTVWLAFWKYISYFQGLKKLMCHQVGHIQFLVVCMCSFGIGWKLKLWVKVQFMIDFFGDSLIWHIPFWILNQVISWHVIVFQFHLYSSNFKMPCELPI